jgi:FkbM family methyltransferase
MIASLRRTGRKLYDSLYCQHSRTKFEIGVDCTWFVETSHLKARSIVYSGGAGNDISFEIEINKRYGCDVFLFDPSDTGKATVERAACLDPGIHYYEFGLAKSDELVRFSKPKDVQEGSYSIASENISENDVELPCRSLYSLATEHRHQCIDLLKLDIEGFEYDVLEHALLRDLDIRQICVEFHHFFPEIPRSKTKALVQLLKKKKYQIIHKRMCDYTFLRDDIGASV